MAIKKFQPATNAQTTKYYSSIRSDISVYDIKPLVEDEEFCTCIIQCVPCLKSFTDTIGIDGYKNDFYLLFQNSITGGSHEAYIVIDGVESAVIADDTYGKKFNMTSCYAYRFDAFKIHALHGYCEYYGILINKDSLGNIVQQERTPCFKLEKFTERAANRTVKIETQQKGKLLHGKDYSLLVPVGGVKPFPCMYQQIRLPGAFFLSGMPIEKDGIVLNNSNRSRMQIMDKMRIEYELEFDIISSEQAMTTILDYLFAEVCMITDYNVYNWEKYLKVRVVRNGNDFKPKIQKRKSFSIKLEREFDNIQKTND